MKISTNNGVRELTAAEVLALQKTTEALTQTNEPTPEERIAALEAALLELLGVETDG